MADVVVVGSLNVDVVVTAERLPAPGETVLAHAVARHPGGKGLNQAIAAARQGASVAIIGVVGDDADGEWLARVARDEGIDTTGLRCADGVSTGLALITVDQAGDNTIVVAAGANGTLGTEHVRRQAQALETAKVVVAQLEVPVETVGAALAVARGGGARTVLNPAPAVRVPATLVADCDVVVPNETEAARLTGLDTSTDEGVDEAARALLAAGAGAIVVTMGGRGARWRSSDLDGSVAAFAVDAVDATAAGDAFCGALAASLARGDSFEAALRRASAAGALATTVAGATPSLPTAAAVDDLLAVHG